MGRDIYIATPKGREPSSVILDEAKQIALSSKSKIVLTNDPAECVKDADIIYTDVWVSMGQESKKDQILDLFEGYQVNEELVSKAGNNARIMHCLPAHRGEEITDQVMDSQNSIVYGQAENRLHVQKAILLKLLGD